MRNIRRIVKKGDYLYAVVPEHPRSNKHGYVLVHRVVMENHLDRLLEPNEIVHHIDGNKKNNDITNLMVMLNEEHVRMHHTTGITLVKLVCPWCGKEFIRQKRRTYLCKPNKLNCTCCCASCRGKLSSYAQYHGLTHKLEVAISGNVLTIWKENPEVTAYDRNRRDYTQPTCNGEEIVQPTTVKAGRRDTE